MYPHLWPTSWRAKPAVLLISGTCSSPGTHNATRSQRRAGLSGLLVASLLPGQMARLLGGRRGFLERCDCTAKGPIKQRTEVLTAANAFTWEHRDCPSQEILAYVPVCVYFLLGMGFPKKGWLRSKREKLIKKHSVKAQKANEGRWVDTEATTSERLSIIKGRI